MHGTQVYSAAEIKAACEEVWNDRGIRFNCYITEWHFWHLKKCGWQYDLLTAFVGRMAKFKDYRSAQMRRIRKHQVYGQAKIN